MEELLARLCRAAAHEGACAEALLENGLRLLAYPLEGRLLVVVGWPAASGRHVDGETLLRRRGEDIARYGAWLPAQFNDGGWYLVLRAAGNEAPDADQLTAAEELLL
ncbi:hypothetical protein IP92_05476 [Pseudoduganella flava]|uniref:Uncharacterized protein n=1 Tax=Pseudoduganella flava TaxID=871742 RepID=A0A562PE46_9BURK|nr:hypothetical protein [Pseudoduganella flava]QGZ42128.1 hypothetical protein GO485_25845 [Pseudoduganella flava]TWI42500.1 hypothetical protein IP92_05476 [Pseudoduganella flava]